MVVSLPARCFDVLANAGTKRSRASPLQARFVRCGVNIATLSSAVVAAGPATNRRTWSQFRVPMMAATLQQSIPSTRCSRCRSVFSSLVQLSVPSRAMLSASRSRRRRNALASCRRSSVFGTADVHGAWHSGLRSFRRFCPKSALELAASLRFLGPEEGTTP